MDDRILKIINEIEEKGDLDKAAIEAAEARQEQLAKPTGALGDLEAMTVQLAGITGQVKNEVKKQAIAIFSADNGVCEEGVASAPQSVTFSQTINFTRGLTGVSSMAKYWGIDLLVCDMGVKMDLPESLLTEHMTEPGFDDHSGMSCMKKLTKKIVNRRLAKGTADLAKGPAMTEEQFVKAFLTGIEAAKTFKELGYQVFGVGEMGIGNTTTSACVLAALTDKKADGVVGRGGGLTDEGLNKKLQIVDEAVARVKGQDVMKILQEVGGFDIAAMVGAYIGAAYYKLPVVIDGYISAVAALAAARIQPKCVNYMFASHKSKEPGYVLAMEALGVKPIFDLGMRLGEGSGCPITFKIMETACATMNGMATYAEGAIDADYLDQRKEGNFF
ncbi:MAG: nicotinate-nucleotide--dimethylbenzimidazole phosphoribosyltransferase [Firmicutes bacterium]|nr:nicotinate-nucleotide--dimethylbenzimidazole phosphoribosyltransferase [Bacillota bacterium]